MDEAARAETSATVELGAAAVQTPSMNGYGAGSHAPHPDALMLIGAAFLGGLLLGGLVSRIAS